MPKIITAPALESIEVGQRLSFAEWEFIGDGEMVAKMDGVASTFEVWHLETDGDPRIIAVEYPTTGTGRHPGYNVVAVGEDSEYPRVLADVVGKITEQCKKSWG